MIGVRPRGKGSLRSRNPWRKREKAYGLSAESSQWMMSTYNGGWMRALGPSIHGCLRCICALQAFRRQPTLEFHTDCIRSLVAGDISERKVGWMKDRPARKDIDAEISRLGQIQKGHGGAGAALPMDDDPGAGLQDWQVVTKRTSDNA